MEDSRRWSVTYTKHVKQKRKVYQDGFLELQTSRHKVMLYDEWEKLLDSRFVKKDDVINSGETLAFDSYLVDIGELCRDHRPTSTSSCQEKEGKVAEKLESLYGYSSKHNSISVDVKPMFGKSKGRVINLSPSKKMIRDFKMGEMNKYGSSPSCMDITKTSTTEWQVLYTTQITQKAKKFHDGFLQLLVCGFQGRQVILYDTTRRQLDSRFLKKDELVCSGESLAFQGHLVEIGEVEGDHKPVTDSVLQGNSGETLAFDSYLVDIGEICRDRRPTSTLSCQEKERKVAEISESFYSYGSKCNSISVDMKPMFGKSKGQAINLSPSKKMIRDFKKTEINKYVSSPCSMDITKTSTTEWQVMYTTQITQKAKKFHDGFLQLLVRGSQAKQVMLYDTTRRQLDSRFLKKDEIVCSGESLVFQGHLVEIGEIERDHEPVTDSILQDKNYKVVGETDTASNQAKIPSKKKVLAEKTPDKTSSGKVTSLNDSSFEVENAKLSMRTPANEPRRAVHDILSILRKPIQGKIVQMNEPFLEEHLGSHPSDVHSDIKNHIKIYAEECSGRAGEELSETTSDQDHRIKVLKPEAIEDLSAAEKVIISENEKEPQVRSSSFCLRSRTTNCTTPMLNIDGIDHNKLESNSSSVEPHYQVTAVLDSRDQMRIESPTLTISKENLEPEKPPEIVSEIMNETNAAAINILSSSELPKLCEDNNGSSSKCDRAACTVNTVVSSDCTSHNLFGVEEKTPKQHFHTRKMDEFPSFDLGF